MSREDNIYYARLAEQGERYEDMIRYMKEVSKVRKGFSYNGTKSIVLNLTDLIFFIRKSKSYQMRKGIS